MHACGSVECGWQCKRNGRWQAVCEDIYYAYVKLQSLQLNGKAKRSHRTEETEFCPHLTYMDDVDLEEALTLRERTYNLSRPRGDVNGMASHEALREEL